MSPYSFRLIKNVQLIFKKPKNTAVTSKRSFRIRVKINLKACNIISFIIVSLLPNLYFNFPKTFYKSLFLRNFCIEIQIIERPESLQTKLN